MNKDTADKWFYYDSETGVLFWRKKFFSKNAGDMAGSIGSRGYVTVRFNKKIYQVHRIVWLMHHGEMPVADIDHINQVKSDNRIENLRAASRSENQRNHSLSKRNTSGFKNVIWCRYAWEVVLRINVKKVRFGIYRDIELADLVAREAREKYYGEFYCHR